MSRYEYEYENDHDDDRYKIDDHDDDHGYNHYYTGTSTATIGSVYSENVNDNYYTGASTGNWNDNYVHGYRFAITNGTVTGITEIEHGYAQQERMEFGETWSVVGSQVIKTEMEHGFTQTSVYADTNGDGIFTKVSQTYAPETSGTVSSVMSFNSISGGNDTDDVWAGSDSSDDYYGAVGDDQLHGGRGYDRLYGGNGNDDLYGDEGDDHLYGSNGNDHIYGGVGKDDAYYEGNHTEYMLMRTGSALQLEDSNTLRDGTDTLESVERIHFADISLAFDTGAGDIAGEAYRMYQAALDRTPDLEGLGHWIRVLESGQSLETVASGFINSEEFQQKYGAATSAEEFVTLLYNNVLDRDPDPEGLNNWVNALESGINSRESTVVGFSESQEFINMTVQLVGNGVQYQEAIF